MTDRDHFAAAALTGLLAHSMAPSQALIQYVRLAGEYAGAMLRERGDTEPLPKEKRAEVVNQEPAAWIAFATDGSESSAVYMMQEQAQAAADEWGWSIAPLYAAPKPTFTPKELDAISWAAWVLPSVRGTLEGILKRRQ